MKYIQKPSLEHIALVKIVTTLWRQKDIRDLISNCSDLLIFKTRQNKFIENRVIEKVSELPLPESLKKKIISFVKPIGMQIYKWMHFHHTNNNLALDLLGELCWTPQGTIDRKKTAEVLIKGFNLDIVQRYKLACIYCLENHIIDLWNEIAESCRQSLLMESHIGIGQLLIKIHWPHIMRVGSNNPSHSDQDLFESCASENNKIATKYFLQKLTSAEREESLVKAAKCVEDSELFIFLLSQMNEEQEKEVFKNNPYKVLMYLLDWPFQNFFIEIVHQIWEFLSRIDFDLLLKKIMEKITDGYEDYNYGKLFEIFWEKSPSDFKSYVIGEHSSRYVLRYLYEIKDRYKIKFIFLDATLLEKKTCIHFFMKEIFRCLSVSEEEWDFLKFFIQEWLPSGTERIKIKKELERNIEKRILKENKSKWNRLFFQPDFVSKDNSTRKRRLEEEGESSSSNTSHITQ